MSELFRHIKAIDTGEKVPIWGLVDYKREKSEEYSFATRYLFSVRIEEEIFINHELLRRSDINIVKLNEERFLEKLRHLVYGDMEYLLREMEKALFAGDIDKAMEINREIRQEMYND